jgi:transcriptional regulator with XRE-family HTH domain
MTLGEKIKALRDTRNMSRIRMAERCDISDAELAKYEADKLQPDQGMLEKIAEILETTVEDLLDEGDVSMGTCLYCGQSMIFEGVHATQEELDAMATQQCNCEEAKIARKKKQDEEDKERERLRRIEAAICNAENLFEEMPEARDLVKKAIPALVDFALKKVTISDGEVTASVWRDANGKVTVEKRRTIIDQADSE